MITTVAGTTGVFPPTPLAAKQAPLGSVYRLCLDPAGSLIVSDAGNNMVMRVNADGSLVVLAGNGVYGFSGDGVATAVSLASPSGCAVDSSGNIYVADSGNNRIRRISADGNIATVAGGGPAGDGGDGGPATSAQFSGPDGLAIDPAGNLYVADYGNGEIRMFKPGGTIRTVAGRDDFENFDGESLGDNGPATSAWIPSPTQVVLDSSGSMYIADLWFNRIRVVSPSGTITTFAGSGKTGFSGDGGPATAASFFDLEGLAIDASGSIYIGDSRNNRVRKVASGIISTVAGNGTGVFSGDGGSATSAGLSFPAGVAVDRSGKIYIADTSNERVRVVASGVINTLAGSGTYQFAGDGSSPILAQLNAPYALTVDANGNIFVSDTYSNRIRKISKGTITTIAGGGSTLGDTGLATSAALETPEGIAVDPVGNVYVADFNNFRIRKISPAGIITTVAGTGVEGYSGDGGLATSAKISFVYSIAVDAAGNLYLDDVGNSVIREVAAATGVITTVVGNGQYCIFGGMDCGDGSAAKSAQLASPTGVAVDSAGNIYIADQDTFFYTYAAVRKVTPGSSPVIRTIAGSEMSMGSGSGDGGYALQAQFENLLGISVDQLGNVFVIDGNRIREITTDGKIRTVAGNGQAGLSGDGGLALNATLKTESPISVIAGVATDQSGNIYIADTGNNRIREVFVAGSSISYQAAPSKLSFTANAGGAVTGAQSIALNPQIGGLSFTASASSTSTNVPWLNVSPSSGGMPATLQVTADPSGLSAGTYAGTITIAVPNAVPPTATVAVTFTVQSSTPPALGVDTPSLSFTTTQGGGNQTLQLHVQNTGGGSLAFTATAATTSGGPWLSVSPGSGAATPSSPASLSATANIGTLAPGTYSGTIAIAGAGSTVTVSVTLSIAAPNNVILISQTGLSFQAVAQGGTPLPQSFGILNTGQGPMNWSANAATLSGGSGWLSIDQTSGTVTRPYLDVSLVNVSINPSGLAPGDYYGRIQVTAAAANSPQTVMVLVTVLPPGTSPGPQLQPTGLIFTGTAGFTPASQDVLIGNPKPQADNFLTGSIGSGFSFLPTNAQVLPNQPTPLHVFPDFSKVQAGTIQRGTITLQFADGTPRTVRVLTVVAPSTATASSIGGERIEAAACVSGNPQVQPTALTDPSSSVVTISQPVGLQVRVVDSCGNAVTSANGAVTAGFSNNDARVTLAHVGNGNWQGTWKPQNASQSQVTITFTAFAIGGTTSVAGTSSVTVTVRPATNTPVTTGAANAASGVGAFISPGGLVSIYGQQLADTASTSSGTPFPTDVNGTQVLIGGRAVPMRYVGTGQINAQVPFELAANTTQQLIVQHGTTLSVPQDLVVAAAQPGVYTQDSSGAGAGIIVDGNTNVEVTPSTPAHIGDTVVIYCNGLGAVNPALPTGTPAPLQGPLSSTVNPVTVTIGGINANVQFAGLVPGYPDFYQVNAVVPVGVTPGDQLPVILTVAGQSSPPVTMAVQ